SVTEYAGTDRLQLRLRGLTSAASLKRQAVLRMQPVPRRLRGLTSAASLKHRMQDTLVLGCEGATPRTHVRGLIEARTLLGLCVGLLERLRGLTSPASLQPALRAAGSAGQRDSADSRPRPH